MANNYEFYKRFKDVDETIQNLTKKIKGTKNNESFTNSTYFKKIN